MLSIADSRTKLTYMFHKINIKVLKKYYSL